MSCGECKIYQLKYDWNTHRGSGARAQHRGEDWLRDGPPPCQECPADGERAICPKIGPEHEHEFTFNAANYRVWELFWAVQGGARLTDEEASDPRLRKRLTIIARLVKQAEQHKRSEAISEGVDRLAVILAQLRK